LAKEGLYRSAVVLYLLQEFIAGIQEAQAVIVCLRQELHAPGLGQGVKSADYLGCVKLQLLKQRAGQAVRDPESSFMSAYQIQEQAIGRQITLVGNLPADKGILVVVKIAVVLVEYGVVS
jgi:hypothetical protein